MFALSIALLGLAVIAAKFTFSGEAGTTAGVATTFVAGILSVISMIAYWRRRETRSA